MTPGKDVTMLCEKLLHSGPHLEVILVLSLAMAFGQLGPSKTSSSGSFGSIFLTTYSSWTSPSTGVRTRAGGKTPCVCSLSFPPYCIISTVLVPCLPTPLFRLAPVLSKNRFP